MRSPLRGRSMPAGTNWRPGKHLTVLSKEGPEVVRAGSRSAARLGSVVPLDNVKSRIPPVRINPLSIDTKNYLWRRGYRVVRFTLAFRARGCHLEAGAML